jgi:2-iminobutanoate/2-iminopropanoate deaminase
LVSKREAIHVAGITHGPGRPSGSRIGNIIYSAAISGRDPLTNELPSDPADQMRALFASLDRFVQAAGATMDDIIRVGVVLAGPQFRDALNVEWAKYFNDETSLPVRNVVMGDVPGGAIAYVEIVAVVQE